MTIRVEKRSYSCGTGDWLDGEGRRLMQYAENAVYRVRQRYSVWLVIANGRRVDSFQKKRNATRLAAKLLQEG